MKKTICMLLAVIMVFALTACGTGSPNVTKQTATAYLEQDGDNVVEATVDLSGGWSVEFARGAIYLYDGEITEGKEAVSMLITLDKEVYDEYMDEAMADANHKEADGGVYYTRFGSEGAYLTSVDNAAYFLITATNKADIEALASRYTLALEQ